MASDARAGINRQIALIGTGGFLLSFIANFFIVFSCSLFLKTLGAQTLPLYYIVLNTLSVLLGAFLFARDSAGALGLWASNILMAVFFAAVGLLYSPGEKTLIFAAYLAVMLFQIYSLIFYWNLINHSLTMPEIKKHTGAITVWIMLGAITAGFSVKPMVHLFSEKEIFLLGAALTLLFTLNLEIFLEGLERKKEQERLPRQKLVFRELLKTDLVSLLALFTLIFCVMRYLGEYQFSHGAALRFSGSKELSGFLGNLHAVTSCAILLWQTVFSSRFFKAWPVATSYSVIALTLLFLSALCAAHPAFYLLAIFNFSALFFSKTLKHQALIVFIKAVPHGARSRTNFLLGGIAESGSVIGAGLLILIFNHFNFSLRLFFIIALSLAALLALISIKLNIAYIRMLLKNINPGFFLRSLGLNIFSGLLRRRAAWKTRNRQLYIGSAREVLETGGNPLSVIKAMETLSILDSPDSINHIIPFTNHRNPWVKIAAVTAVLRLARDPKHENTALGALAAMAESRGAFSKVLAGAARKNLETLWFEPYMETFLWDESMEVRRGALAAAARLKNPSLIPVFKRMAQDKNNAGLLPLITRALSRSSRCDESLLSCVEKLPEKYRTRAKNILLFINDKTAFDAALKALNTLSAPLSLSFLEALRNHSQDAGFLSVLRDCLGHGRFSLAPLIKETANDCDNAGSKRHIFDDLAAHCPRQDIHADFAEVSADVLRGDVKKQRARRIFYLALRYALGWKTGEAVEDKLLGHGESEDLALEIIESSVKDVRMKETLYRLLYFLKPPVRIS